MKGLRFIPSDTRIGFIRYRMISFAVSGLLMLASLGLFFTAGLNYGIDFKGGTLIEVRQLTNIFQKIFHVHIRKKVFVTRDCKEPLGLLFTQNDVWGKY